MKKSLIFRYTFHQMAYWATAAGIVSFATAFLLEKGFAASTVGILLASGNLLSCVLQPILADWADRLGGNVLKWMTVVLTALCALCFLAVQLLSLPGMVFGLLYLMGIFTFDAMMPLMNAISVFYSDHGFRINYGVGRGLGSLAFALSALAIGEVIANFGGDWMVWISFGLLLCNGLVVLSYPSVRREAHRNEKENTCCSVPQFFLRYKWYCMSLLGVMLLAMFHAMTENYLIEIVKPLGGDSGSVGVSLFIATAIETLVIVFFDRVRRVMQDNLLMKLAGLSFLLKAILFLVAPNVTTVYFIQLLQATSYSFLSPTQLYYANAKINPADMVKGQAFITAAYTLGCAIGNFAGGQLLQHLNLTAMLIAGIVMAAAGTLILFLTVDKSDS